MEFWKKSTCETKTACLSIVIFWILGEEMRAKTEKPEPVPTPVRNTCLPDPDFAGPDDATQPGEVPKDVSVSQGPSDSRLDDPKTCPMITFGCLLRPLYGSHPNLRTHLMAKMVPMDPFLNTPWLASICADFGR